MPKALTTGGKGSPRPKNTCESELNRVRKHGFTTFAFIIEKKRCWLYANETSVRTCRRDLVQRCKDAEEVDCDDRLIDSIDDDDLNVLVLENASNASEDEVRLVDPVDAQLSDFNIDEEEADALTSDATLYDLVNFDKEMAHSPKTVVADVEREETCYVDHIIEFALRVDYTA